MLSVGVVALVFLFNPLDMRPFVINREETSNIIMNPQFLILQGIETDA